MVTPQREWERRQTSEGSEAQDIRHTRQSSILSHRHDGQDPRGHARSARPSCSDGYVQKGSRSVAEVRHALPDRDLPERHCGLIGRERADSHPEVGKEGATYKITNFRGAIGRRPIVKKLMVKQAKEARTRPPKMSSLSHLLTREREPWSATFQHHNDIAWEREAERPGRCVMWPLLRQSKGAQPRHMAGQPRSPIVARPRYARLKGGSRKAAGQHG
jgi:hypothetical protein